MSNTEMRKVGMKMVNMTLLSWTWHRPSGCHCKTWFNATENETIEGGRYEGEHEDGAAGPG